MVFAETNWIFDGVFKRDVNAEYMFELAQQDRIVMSIPRFAFAESRGQSEVVIQRRIDNIQLALASLRELRRSRHRAEEANQLITSLQEMINQLKQELSIMQNLTEDIKLICDIIPYDMEIQARARLRVIERQPPFAENDSVIYESILWFAEQNQEIDLTMLFLTRNRRDFDYPHIYHELEELGIELFFETGECVRRLRELLGFSEN